MGTEDGARETKRSSQAVWDASPAGTTHAPAYRPGTKEFFDTARTARKRDELRFLNTIPPVASFGGKSVLEVGCGAGFDAFDLCTAGAQYTGIDIASENPVRCRQHLSFYGLRPAVLQADAENLPFRDGSFDVIFSNGVLHHTPDIRRSFRELTRVLRPGGEAWIILYHRRSIFYMVTLWLVQHLLLLGFRKMTFTERLGRIEHTSSERVPLVRAFTRREVRDLMSDAGMSVAGVWVRKLSPEDLPNLPFLRYLWRVVPRSWLDAVGRIAGWYVIVQGRKGMRQP